MEDANISDSSDSIMPWDGDERESLNKDLQEVQKLASYLESNQYSREAFTNLINKFKKMGPSMKEELQNARASMATRILFTEGKLAVVDLIKEYILICLTFIEEWDSWLDEPGVPEEVLLEIFRNAVKCLPSKYFQPLDVKSII